MVEKSVLLEKVCSKIYILEVYKSKLAIGTPPHQSTNTHRQAAAKL